jgi:hypothetical protein
VELERPRSVSGAKVTAAVLTGGLSAAATGGLKSRKGAGTEVIYMDAITSVATKRDTMLNDCVSVVTAGSTIDFRVSKKEAGAFKDAILKARSEYHQRTSQPVVVQAAAPAEASLSEKLKELTDLRDAGVLSDEEFSAAKATLLGI